MAGVRFMLVLRGALVLVLLSVVLVIIYAAPRAVTDVRILCSTIDNSPTLPNNICPQAGSKPSIDHLDRNGQVSVLVWNIHKQLDGNWPDALLAVSKGSDLLLLQEVGLESNLTTMLAEQGLSWSMATALSYRPFSLDFSRREFGVMIAANAQAQSYRAKLATEPWLRLPKASLINRFSLSSGEQLLVANLHGINFTFSTNDWRHQLGFVFDEIAAHQGPVILGGDINSWGQQRLALLLSLAKSHDLMAAEFTPDTRLKGFGVPLDWIFYRGLRLVEASTAEVDSSDHNPLRAQFLLMP